MEEKQQGITLNLGKTGSIKATRIGTHLQMLREDAGISQEEAAQSLPITASTVGQIERGEIMTPSLPVLRAFAELYNVSMSSLEDMLTEGAMPLENVSNNKSLEDSILDVVKARLASTPVGALFGWGQDKSVKMPAQLPRVESVAFGGNIKATLLDENTGVVEAPAVIFTDASQKDLDGEWFTKSTYYGLDVNGGRAMATFNHRMPIKTDDERANGIFKRFHDYRFKNPIELTMDDAEIMARHLLDISNAYEAFVFEMAQKGHLMWSTGSAPQLTKIKNTGEIEEWYIAEVAYTPTPAQPLNGKITPIKSLENIEVIMSEIDEKAVETNVETTPATDEAQNEAVEGLQEDAVNFVTHDDLLEIIEAQNAKFVELQAHLNDSLAPIIEKVEAVVKSIELGDRDFRTRPTGTTKSRRATMRDTMATVKGLSFGMGNGVEGDGVEEAKQAMLQQVKTDPRFGIGDDFNA